MEQAIGAAIGALFWVGVFYLLEARKQRRNSRANDAAGK